MESSSTSVSFDDELDELDDESSPPQAVNAAVVEVAIISDKNSANKFFFFIKHHPSCEFSFHITRVRRAFLISNKKPRYTILIQKRVLGKHLCILNAKKV